MEFIIYSGHETNSIINYPAEVKQTWGFEQINFSEDTISIKGLCNGGRGTYSISTVNSSIKFDGIGMTLALCKYEEWEGYLWHNLDSAYAYNINGKQLDNLFQWHIQSEFCCSVEKYFTYNNSFSYKP